MLEHGVETIETGPFDMNKDQNTVGRSSISDETEMAIMIG